MSDAELYLAVLHDIADICEPSYEYTAYGPLNELRSRMDKIEGLVRMTVPEPHMQDPQQLGLEDVPF